MMTSKKEKVLIVAAHPDDEILGCGATMARLSKSGHEVYTLILGEGVTSRDLNRNQAKRRLELNDLRKQSETANRLLGVKKTFVFDLPDNRFDSVDLLDIVKIIEGVKKIVSPTIIFTHYQNDLNVDHQLTYQAVLTATRPQPQETVKEIYSFEVLSSTDWNFPLTFSPDLFVDVEKALPLKLAAMKVYQGELKQFPHPRSLKGIELNAQYWGMKVGKKFVEAFKTIRIIRSF